MQESRCYVAFVVGMFCSGPSKIQSHCQRLLTYKLIPGFFETATSCAHFGLSAAHDMDGLLSVQPEANDTRALMLTAFAASGDEMGVRRVIEADPGSVNELGLDGTSPLCAAAMWGQVAWPY